MVRVGDRVRVRPDMTRWLCMVRVGDRVRVRPDMTR